MKKALVILLILAVAGGAFAQVSFTGTILSGMGILFDNGPTVSNEGPILGIYSMDNAKAFRLNLDAKYTNADATVGSSFRFRIDGAPHFNDGIPAANAIVQHAYGWVKVFDGMITLNGGKIDNGYSFGTGGGIDSSFDIGGGYGLFAIVTPIAGLDIGLSAYSRLFPQLTGDSPKDLTYANTNKDLVNARYHFGVSYTMPDTVTVIAQFRQGNGWTYNQSDAIVGVKVLALKNMGLSTVILDASFTDLQKVKDFMTIQIGEKVVYTQDALEVGGRFLQQFQAGDAAADAADLTFWVWGQYAIGSIVPRLDAMFNMGSPKVGNTYGVLDTDPNTAGNQSKDGTLVDLRRWDGITKGKFMKDAMNLQIRPSVQFRFGGNANNFIELGYAAFVDLGDVKGTPDTSMYHNVFVDYKFSF